METPQKSIFINVYNGFTNISLRKIQSNIKIVELLQVRAFTIAGNKVSLDIIEHGF
jgi:hypothetical protein